MGKFVKGEVVVIPFPFSDLSAAKRRPALVLANVNDEDSILLQITSQNMRDSSAITIYDSDFSSGGLNKKSNVRPNRIFTADNSIVLYKVGMISETKLKSIVDKVIEIIVAE